MGVICRELGVFVNNLFGVRTGFTRGVYFLCVFFYTSVFLLKLYTWAVHFCSPTLFNTPRAATSPRVFERIAGLIFDFRVRSSCVPRQCQATETKDSILDHENSTYNHEEDGHRRAKCPTLTHGSRARKNKHTENIHLDRHGEKLAPSHSLRQDKLCKHCLLIL